MTDAYFGKYRVIRLIGKGGMGTVYEGLDESLNRRVALKTLYLNELDGSELDGLLKRLLEEAKAVARLHHTNIVTLYGLETDEPTQTTFLVMEFVEGPSLGDYFEQSGKRLPLPRIGRIMNELLTALAHAHALNVIHRDIKPANVLIEASSGIVKLADFGLARRLDRTSRMSASTLMVGTPHFMPPEQFLGAEVDARSDVYAAGALLYELLTGNVPFTGDLDQILYQVLHKDPVPPSQINRQLPRELDEVVLRALQKAREDRYASAKAFREALQNRIAELEANLPKVNPAVWDTLTRRRRPTLPPGGAGRPKSATVRKSQTGPGGRGWGVMVAAMAGAAAIAALIAYIAMHAPTPSEPVPAVQTSASPGEEVGDSGDEEAVLSEEASASPEERAPSSATASASSPPRIRRSSTSSRLPRERTRLASVVQGVKPKPESKRKPAVASAVRVPEPIPPAPQIQWEKDGSFRDCATCPEMVNIPAGVLEMGSAPSEAGRSGDEGPVHTVRIGRLAVGKYPITRAEWLEFARAPDVPSVMLPPAVNPALSVQRRRRGVPLPYDCNWENPGFAQSDREPVVCIHWSDAVQYVAWMSQRTRHHYRLLTEAEYEYIERAGTSSAYYWGEDSQCDYANGANSIDFPNGAACSDGYKFTSPVGSFKPNRFGLFDTAGNVFSWTEDCYNRTYDDAPSTGVAWKEGDCSSHVLRGGSWAYSPTWLRSAHRVGEMSTSNSAGLRIARTD